MKICNKCGAIHRDNKVFCVDCGEKLPEPIPKEQETELKLFFNKKIERLHKESDPLRVDLKMKIAAGLHIAGLIFSIFSLITVHSPGMRYAIIAIMFHILCALDAVFPEVLWNLTKLGDFLTYDDPESLKPSDWYGTSRRIVIWAGLAIGIFLTLLSLI